MLTVRYLTFEDLPKDPTYQKEIEKISRKKGSGTFKNPLEGMLEKDLKYYVGSYYFVLSVTEVIEKKFLNCCVDMKVPKAKWMNDTMYQVTSIKKKHITICANWAKRFAGYLTDVKRIKHPTHASDEMLAEMEDEVPLSRLQLAQSRAHGKLVARGGNPDQLRHGSSL